MFRNAIVCALLLLLLCGCILPVSDPLPDDPVVFETGTLETEDGGYVTILWEGRVYAPYGVLTTTFFQWSLGACLGYVDGDVEDLVYALSGAHPEEYLVEYYRSGLMDNPMVFRALGTKGIPIPDNVDPLGYEIWD